MENTYDLAVIGGGINGCGIARDAAGRGLSVFLCEMNDLASGTSSWSTKLIHGGLRYLEYYEFRLVREALAEREVLWSIAPHIIHPLRFILPHRKGLRPAWLLRLGLFMYDHLGGRKKLPPTSVLDLSRDPAGKPLKAGVFGKGFEYSDCWVDDARLVVLNARDAADRGAVVKPRMKAVRAERTGAGWRVDIEDARTGARETVEAKVLVNAGGPWVERVLAGTIGVNARAHVRLVQGSHIVVRKLFEGERAYILQNADRRVIFAIPYERHFTLIGTTDRDFNGDPADVRATPDEVTYLCKAISGEFNVQLSPADVVWSYSGVRPLYDDGASEAKAATRDYVFELDGGEGRAPVLSIYGGKITTYRKLAEEALEWLAPYLRPVSGNGAGWTGKAALPGGDFQAGGTDRLAQELQASYSFLAPSEAFRIAHAYGTRARRWLGTARARPDLGQSFGPSLTEAEVAYLMDTEWAMTADDVVWRRSKLALQMTRAELEALASWMTTRQAGRQSPAPQTRNAP